MGCRKLPYRRQEALEDRPVFLRESLDKKGTPLKKRDDYYPFGMQTGDSWVADNTDPNNYLFNASSELNETTGNYQTFFRDYDPALGRMTGIDIMASKYSSVSPYNFALNDPIGLNDPNGDEPCGPACQELKDLQNSIDSYLAATDPSSYRDAPIDGGGGGPGGSGGIRSGINWGNAEAAWGYNQDRANVADMWSSIADAFASPNEGTSIAYFNGQQVGFFTGSGEIASMLSYNYADGPYATTVGISNNSSGSFGGMTYLNEVSVIANRGQKELTVITFFSPRRLVNQIGEQELMVSGFSNGKSRPATAIEKWLARNVNQSELSKILDGFGDDVAQAYFSYLKKIIPSHTLTGLPGYDGSVEYNTSPIVDSIFTFSYYTGKPVVVGVRADGMINDPWGREGTKADSIKYQK